MIKKIKFMLLFSVLFAVTASVNSFSFPELIINPHDSLLFDGGNTYSHNTIQAGNKNCFVQVRGINGIVIGEVLVKKIMQGCGESETLYVTEIRKLKHNDTLIEGSTLITTPNSWVGLGFFIAEDKSEIFPTKYIQIFESSEIKVPKISELCGFIESHTKVSEIPVIKGVVTYDNEPAGDEELAPLSKIITKGKRSSAKHKKTKYSHEVKISESDTVDIIRVYKGAVEVTMLNIDINEDEMSKKIEKLGEDMQSGKITAQEMQEKMAEFQNYGLMVNELMQPLNVDEGFKCTVTKNTRVVEPLGPGDEDNAGK